MKTPPPKSAFGNMADLDMRHAWKTLGGKSADEAFRIFIQNPFGHIDDFRWIAPEAFIFYFPVVVRYVTSSDSKGDSDTVSSLAGILESQLQQGRHAFMPIIGAIAALCRHVISHYPEYDLDYDIYGDVKSRYEQIGMVVEPDRSRQRRAAAPIREP
jgi:hypothetical protein